jgi:hypothetical protein
MPVARIKPLTASSRVEFVAMRNSLADRIDRLDRSRDKAKAALDAIDEVLRSQPTD